MDSLNGIIKERKQKKRIRNLNYDNILHSTPSTLKVQNSLSEDAVLIEKGNLNNQPLPNNSAAMSKPPSRISNSGYQSVNRVNNDILKMSPRAQSQFFSQLEKIYKENDRIKQSQEFIEQPHSPEYTIVSALDNSCVLFSVKEQQSNAEINVKSDTNSNNSTQRIITPDLLRNIHEPEGPSTIDNPEVMRRLTQRLENLSLEAQEQQDQQSQQQVNSFNTEEEYSTDRQYLIIHPTNVNKLTPCMQPPQVSRQPSKSNFNIFDLSIPDHSSLLRDRLNQIRNIDEQCQQRFEESNQQSENEEISTDKLATMFLSYLDEDQEIENKSNTPINSRGPPSRTGNNNDQIDIDLLVSKLLNIPNETLLESLISVSVGSQTPNNINCFQPDLSSNNDKDSTSNLSSSSGAITPQQHSLATPIQTRYMMEKGFFQNNLKNHQTLDLRSPHTKFNLMRKLQAVKELNHRYEDDLEDDESGLFNDLQEQQVANQDNNNLQCNYNSRGGVEFRSITDYTRLFINEEDEVEEEEEEQEFDSNQVREHTKAISLVSPHRSFNCTTNDLQLRNQNQNQPSIDLLIQKLKNLEQKRKTQGIRIKRFSTTSQNSENESPTKFEANKNQQSGFGSAKHILDQVIKKLERLQSRDQSV